MPTPPLKSSSLTNYKDFPHFLFTALLSTSQRKFYHYQNRKSLVCAFCFAAGSNGCSHYKNNSVMLKLKMHSSNERTKASCLKILSF